MQVRNLRPWFGISSRDLPHFICMASYDSAWLLLFLSPPIWNSRWFSLISGISLNSLKSSMTFISMKVAKVNSSFFSAIFFFGDQYMSGYKQFTLISLSKYDQFKWRVSLSNFDLDISQPLIIQSSETPHLLESLTSKDINSHQHVNFLLLIFSVGGIANNRKKSNSFFWFSFPLPLYPRTPLTNFYFQAYCFIDY